MWKPGVVLHLFDPAGIRAPTWIHVRDDMRTVGGLKTSL
jgi:hypothetical protein